MLETIFKRYSKVEGSYLKYEEEVTKLHNVLSGRRRLEELYTNKDIDSELDKTFDGFILLRRLQRLVEKIKMMIVREKRISEEKHYLKKQELKAYFEITEAAFLESYLGKRGKKTMTAEEKKVVFRTTYKDFYKEGYSESGMLEDMLTTINDERNELLNIRAEIQAWQSIVRRKTNGN